MWAISFSADDRRALAHDRHHHADPQVQRKMEVLWLKSHGLGHNAIAAYADVSRRTVQRYIEEYLEGGLSRLRRCRGHQPQSALAEHRDSLEEYFLKHPPRSAILYAANSGTFPNVWNLCVSSVRISPLCTVGKPSRHW